VQLYEHEEPLSIPLEPITDVWWDNRQSWRR